MSVTVFVVQRPAYYDRVKKCWVDKYDLTSAKDHGDLVFLLRPGNIYRDHLEASIQRLRYMLEEYCEGDHILAIGDPVAIAATVMVASRKTNGKVSLLKFDRRTGRYCAYKVDIGHNEG